MRALRRAAQAEIFDMRPSDNQRTDKGRAALTAVTKHIMAEKRGEYQRQQADEAGPQNGEILVLATAQNETDRAKRNNRRQHPNMKNFIAQNGCAEGRKNTDQKRQGDAVNGT